MKRRNLVLTAVLLLISIMVSACGSSGTSTSKGDSSQAGNSNAASADAKSTEKVELTWYVGNQNGEDYLNLLKNKVIGEFEKQHPNITINMTLNNDPTGIEKQQLAAGAGPDVVALDGPTSLQLFAGAGYLKPLDEYTSKFGWEKTYQSWALETCKKDGKLYGLPEGREGLVVYYNKKMFADNGWEIPKSYSELTALCQKIKDKGIIPFAFGVSDFRQANEWWVSEAYNLALGNTEFKKYLSGEKDWKDPALKDATQKLVDMWKNGYIYEKSGSISQDDATNLFATGKSAMKMEGTWFITTLLSKKSSIDWGMFAMPAWNDGVTPVIPMALAGANGVNVNSKHPEETAEFLNWYLGAEIGKEQLKVGVVYPLNNLDPSSDTNVDSHIVEANNLIKEYSDKNNTGYCSWTYWPPNTETFVWNNLEGLYFGQMSIDDFMSKMSKEFEKDKAKGNLFNFSK